MASNRTLYEFAIPPKARDAFKKISNQKLLNVERALVPAMKEAMYDWMCDVAEDTIKNTPVQGRSGNLFNSLRNSPRVAGTSLDTIRGKYVAIDYAYKQEHGGTVRPVNAQVLTIPLPAALRPDGTPKLARASSWKRYGTFSYQSKKTGRGYLAYKNAAGELVLLYVYVDSVKIKATLGLRKTHNAEIWALVQTWGNIMVQGMLSTNFYALVKDPNKRLQWIESDIKSIRKNFRPVAVY